MAIVRPHDGAPQRAGAGRRRPQPRPGAADAPDASHLGRPRHGRGGSPRRGLLGHGPGARGWAVRPPRGADRRASPRPAGGLSGHRRPRDRRRRGAAGPPGGRPPLRFDLCSINVGSTVAGASRRGSAPTRPDPSRRALRGPGGRGGGGAGAARSPRRWWWWARGGRRRARLLPPGPPRAGPRASPRGHAGGGGRQPPSSARAWPGRSGTTRLVGAFTPGWASGCERSSRRRWCSSRGGARGGSRRG